MIGIILGVAALSAIAIGCGSRKEEKCYVNTPNGRKPCGKDVVKQSPEFVDRDGDRVPDDKDKCPDVPHIGSPDGCPPLCEQDRDSDGVNDCADSCPGTPGVADAAGCTDASYAINADYYRLMQSQSHYQELDANRPCAHLIKGAFNSDAIAWSNGTELKIAETTFVRDSRNDLNLCPLRHPIAQDSQGRYAMLWHRGSAGERSHLSFQRFDGSGTPTSESVEVDNFPLSNLGSRGDFKIAALDLFPNDDAVVTWVNRDKVQAQIFPVNGPASDRILINERSISVERNINPDVSVASDGGVAFVWQEGRGESGPIRSARFSAGLDLTRRQLETVAAVGTTPAVALNRSAALYLWNHHGLQLKADHWSIPQQLSDPDDGEAIAPSLLFDDEQRLVASWLTARDDQNGYRLHLQEFANFEAAQARNHPAPTIIDDVAPVGWAELAQNQSFSSIELLFPREAPRSWQLLGFDWIGSESPPTEPALSFHPTPIAMTAERVALHLCNRGLAPLTVDWELSSGFFLSHDGVSHSQGEEQIAPLVCHVKTLTSERSGVDGDMTLRTNDPNNQEIKIPISRE